MDFKAIEARGLVLLGHGKMGGALLSGWLRQGLNPQAVQVITPHPSEALKATGVRIGGPVPADAAVAVVAVKPQKMADALPQLAPLGGGRTLFVSVAAGIRLAAYEAVLGAGTPVVRAMPNTPAAIGQGITPIIGNASASEADLTLAEGLLSAVGQVVRLDAESQMDAVTAVSGSGPAYVFHLIETLAAAGVAEGLSPELALTLARATVAGAGALAMQSPDDPAQLRINVTSPGGTTAAALAVLMEAETGFPGLLNRAVHAAAERGRELGK
ncbi:pyrroline-5-carboxylate reductase [Paenirhodobacter enshiensis]|uniref:pyrroline-5-carboxylate reductase n=1 Tax=Paenirhodobacter enshiensis TaxID=1105367 RepID=UPI0035B18643